MDYNSYPLDNIGIPYVPSVFDEQSSNYETENDYITVQSTSPKEQSVYAVNSLITDEVNTDSVSSDVVNELYLGTTEAAAEVIQTITVNDNVWISKSGKKYHTVPDCSGMKNPVIITVSDALSKGLSPCKKCCQGS